MASATAARLPFSFHPRTLQPPTTPNQTKPSRTQLPIPLPNPRPLTTPCSSRTLFTLSSIDVSKEDKPTDPPAEPEESGEQGQEQEQELDGLFDKRRLEEQFAVLNTGVYECRSCGYKYDKAAGDPAYPIPPGLDFEKLPEDWRCPTCGASRSFFVSKRVEIAGFAQNQRFGLGGNTLTSGQKALLIYGSLLLFFLLFLSGYFLQ